MAHGKGLITEAPVAESFLEFRGQSEAKLLNVPPLADLPDDAWRIMWDGLARSFRYMIGDFFSSAFRCELQETPVQFAPGWYWGDQTPSMSVWHITPSGQEYCFLGDGETVNKLLTDLHLVPWRVWHVICNIECMRKYWRGESQTILPERNERLTSLEAYRRIQGWLFFEYLKEE